MKAYKCPIGTFELKEAAAVVILSRTGIGLLGIIITLLRIPAFLYIPYEVARQLFLCFERR